MTRQFPDKPLGWLQLAAATGRAGDTDAVAEILEAGLGKARPPTALRQELVRIQLERMRAAEDPERKAPRPAGRRSPFCGKSPKNSPATSEPSTPSATCS